MKKNIYVCVYIYNWITSLYTWNYHGIVNELYFKNTQVQLLGAWASFAGSLRLAHISVSCPSLSGSSSEPSEWMLFLSGLWVTQMWSEERQIQSFVQKKRPSALSASFHWTLMAARQSAVKRSVDSRFKFRKHWKEHSNHVFMERKKMLTRKKWKRHTGYLFCF